MTISQTTIFESAQKMMCDDVHVNDDVLKLSNGDPTSTLSENSVHQPDIYSSCHLYEFHFEYRAGTPEEYAEICF